MRKGVKAVVAAVGWVGMLVGGQAQAQHPNEVFIGSYGLTVSYDGYYGDDEAAGFQVGYSREFNRNFGFRGSVYSLEHEDYSEVDVTGLDLSVVGGLLGSGFNLFGGLGLFSEEWEAPTGYSRDFSGLQLVGGVGYNWERVGLDLVLGIRDPSDYEDFLSSVGTDVEATAVTGSLNIGYRF